MKKRKTYKISIIDKTYSKIISDETRFYTSDTALELGFELKETDYNFESAEIVLLNIDDRSLVTRPVAKVLDSFAYELEDDITAHFGEWRGQLRFEQAGETYVSSPVKFRIENDLSNERPPQLSDVQSWVSLKRYADSLTEELKQAVLSVEGMDDTFQTSEFERQTTFKNAEQSRQTTFETNESERDETFEINETTRQTQELEREEAEVKRQTVFDGNEANRTETFNTNEVTRQANEITRQQSEIQRQSTFETNESERQSQFETAEQSRQSSEQQRIESEILRVERDAKREIEIDNLKERVNNVGIFKIENSVSNGNFDNGTVGWQNTDTYSCKIEVTNGIAKNITSNNLTNRSFIYTNLNIPTENVIYTTANIKQEGLENPKLFIFNGITGNSVIDIKTLSNDGFKAYSGIGKSTGSNIVRLYISEITSKGEYSLYLDNLMIFDLTSIFGAGKEPTKEVMDWVVSENGYFDEFTLSHDDIQQYEINQLRKAVIALGGTI